MQCKQHNLTNGYMQTQTNKIPRNSSIELLRIITMFFITICHFATHGNFHFEENSMSIMKFWWYFIEMGGNFGVNVFVLISGYFLIKSTSGRFDFKKILK